VVRVKSSGGGSTGFRAGISGTVVSALDGEPLPGVTVRFVASAGWKRPDAIEKFTMASALSKADGSFSLQGIDAIAAGDYPFTVSGDADMSNFTLINGTNHGPIRYGPDQTVRIQPFGEIDAFMFRIATVPVAPPFRMGSEQLACPENPGFESAVLFHCIQPSGKIVCDPDGGKRLPGFNVHILSEG